MSTANDSTSDNASATYRREPPRLRWRDRSMQSWRARKAVLASRGEVNGPRVAECNEALSYWRMHATLLRELQIDSDAAHSLLSVIERQHDAAVSR
ncbi:hypothetical protein BJN37_06775 [Mycobacterium avium subsp. hominissuis]|uniref:hypothetical protein n=1 Tax=Mycobacterium avium TaxID=1764 RepID=UPI001555EE6E|nr:hypothetical protein [Mycobacterium avium]